MKEGHPWRLYKKYIPMTYAQKEVINQLVFPLHLLRIPLSSIKRRGQYAKQHQQQNRKAISIFFLQVQKKFPHLRILLICYLIIKKTNIDDLLTTFYPHTLFFILMQRLIPLYKLCCLCISI